MSTIPPTRRALDSHALQVLAHPLRSRILTALRRNGPATATTLAIELATNTGATSYHLRKLADVELVEAAEPGRGKERWWKASTESHGWSETDVIGDPDGEAASKWLRQHYFRQLTEEYSQWIDDQDTWPVPWRNSAIASDWSLALSPAQLDSLSVELSALLLRYQDPDDDPGADVRRVRLQLHAYPTDRE